MFSREEVAELALHQLSSYELDHAVAAFNGFAELFSRDWIREIFRGSKTAILVRALASAWNDWLQVAQLPNADQILARWRQGFSDGGVLAELFVMARLSKLGATPELFVAVDGHVPDCRATLAGQSLFFEISQRGISEISRRANRILFRLSDVAAEARPGFDGKVAILREINDREIERASAWLQAGPGDGDRFEDFAIFFAGDPGELHPTRILEDLVPFPRLFSTTIKSGQDGQTKRGTCVIGISDSGAQELLESEASQLSRDEGGVIALDISSVIGGIAEWTPLIQRRFQPGINRRIRGVLLFKRVNTLNGPAVDDASFLENPFTRNPLSLEWQKALQSLLR